MKNNLIKMQSLALAIVTSIILLASTLISAHAVEALEVTSIQFTGESHTAYSFNDLKIGWRADNPQPGAQFTVTLPETLIWGSQLTYPLTNEAQETVGECVSTTQTLTCTLNESVSKYQSLTGSVQQTASIRESAVGHKSEQIVASNSTYTVAYPSAVVPQRDVVYPGTYKFGWAASKDTSGLIQYGWWVYSDKGTERTIVDETASPDLVQCTPVGASYWDELVYRPTISKTDHTVSFSVENPTDVCRAKFFSQSTASKVTNVAKVNGVEVSTVAEYKQSGSGNTSGDEKPTPQPKPEEPKTPVKPEPVKPVEPKTPEAPESTPQTVKTVKKAESHKTLATTGVSVLGLFIPLILLATAGIAGVAYRRER